ncbi:MAG: GHKL domain-containing protein [Desulfobacula sp.]|uniref:sensor histidine kinase n=1 Tax=Desulfobacula sp. TaxID=2593537 RepID=UPI0025B8F328|nr:PAS domain-containing sensor histidine kinase [Desulfobacula sp.]MCD4722860.1 GHKL domain-containing protein [Desulfobacula sp.]
MDQSLESTKKTHYSRLFRRFTFLTMVCSLAPLLLAGWAINTHYSKFARERMEKTLQTRVDYHRKIIEFFLEENRTQLDFIIRTHSMASLIENDLLNHIFKTINSDSWIMTDIGIIGENGDHLAYVGPYDLIDKNYSATFWFKEVMEKGSYTSDMFMGFRKEPHFVMAVIKNEGGHRWILRATINTDWFRSLVENVRIGKTGDVYILNSEGIYQTTPGSGGQIMTLASGFEAGIHDDLKFRFLETGDKDVKTRKIVCETWLKDPKWLLVVRMDENELFEEVRHANRATMFSLHLSALIILIVTVFITRHMVSVIKKRDNEVEGMSRQLMQTGKLASIGELSAGVAHEINNPLAIIMTECQLLQDAEKTKPITDETLGEQFSGSLNQIDTQVRRCKHITRNLMKFARRTKSVIETVDMNVFLKEVIDLMEREAKSDGISFKSIMDDELKPILSDPSQLQQVFLNLINNAIAAHEDKGYGMITIATRPAKDKTGIVITVEDTGSGINNQNIDKIFDPFFTTKSPGQGTGLGLSICYSIVKQLGGDIAVESDIGKGTLFTLTFPLKPPEDLMKQQ